MAIGRGTTPEITLTMDGETFANCTVYVTIDQGGVQITKNSYSDNGEMYLEPILDESGTQTGTIIHLFLTQSDTLSLDVGQAEVQVRWIGLDQKAHKSDIATITLARVLLEEVINYVSD